jgi:hypothetical protein
MLASRADLRPACCILTGIAPSRWRESHESSLSSSTEKTASRLKALLVNGLRNHGRSVLAEHSLESQRAFKRS